MSKFDYLSEAKIVRNQLVGDQLSNWKQRIDKAIEDGATGTEILMALRWTMAELLKASPNLPPDVIARVKNYIIEANRLLG